MSQALALARGTTTGKILFIAVLVLVLLIPLGMIRDLIEDRESTRLSAEIDISRAWGGRQTIGGPIVVLPVTYRIPRDDAGSDPVTVNDELYFLPHELMIEGDAESQVLERGIFDIPVYTASLSISGRLRAPDLDVARFEIFEPRWDQAVLALPLSDARSITDRIAIDVGGTSAEFGPGGHRVPGLGEQLVVPLGDLGLESFDSSEEFSIDLRVAGSASLHFLPLGDVTTVTIASSWPEPSFQGTYLPAERNVDAAGFDAVWRISALGRGYPASFSRSTGGMSSTASFGVVLMPPLSVHEAALKASKYGVLFVGLSFVAFFLFEIFRKLRLHAMHYLSVGMANVIFYLLLLAMAEHFGFGLAYILSAAASILLIAGYASAILGGPGRAIPIAGLLVITYLQLYMILNAEDFAVLIGALTLFGLLAGFMYLTRHVDWFALDPAQIRHSLRSEE